VRTGPGQILSDISCRIAAVHDDAIRAEHPADDPAGPTTPGSPGPVDLPPLAALPARHALVDDVYEALKRAIMDHSIAPSARMSIDGLSRELAVSQTPIREALARLESDGLVHKTALKGYSASPMLTRDELDDLFGLRLLLEPWAAGEAARRLTDQVAQAIRAELASVPEVPDGTGYGSYQVVTAHDTRFHDLLLAAAGNRAVRQAFDRTHCHLHIFRLHYGSGMGGEALREHRAVADAVLRGDPDAAHRAMAGHLTASRGRLVQALP